MSPEAATEPTWQPTACVLCACNCGIEVQVEDGNITRVKGDRAHPGSKGYACEKAQRLAYYQGNPSAHVAAPPHAPTAPTRRSTGTRRSPRSRPDSPGSATSTAAASIFYYGGGGQGNHLGGAYCRRDPLRARGPLLLQRARAGEDRRDLDRRAPLRPRHPHRARLRARRGRGLRRQEPVDGSRHPARAPDAQGDRRRPRPHADRHRSAPQRDGRAGRHPPPGAAGRRRLPARRDARGAGRRRTCSTTRSSRSRPRTTRRSSTAVEDIDVDDYCARADVDAGLVREAARRIGTAASVSILEDLGIQQAPHSTLNSYLEKLLWALTGNFARPGCTNLHTSFSPNGLRRPHPRVAAPDPGHAASGSSPGCSRRRRSPRRSSTDDGPLPRRHHREQQPGPLAARLSADARGDGRPRLQRRDRHRHDRDRRSAPTTSCPRRPSTRSTSARSSTSSSPRTSSSCARRCSRRPTGRSASRRSTAARPRARRV